MPSDATPVSSPIHHTLAVSEADNGARLDKWLAALLPELSRTRLKALIEDGQVTASDLTITDASYRVKSAQIVRVSVPPALPAAPEAQDIPLTVVYEDEDLLVIDKQAGLVVHPAPGTPDRTLVNALLAHCGNSLSGVGGVKRPGIVHRLDKDTSGLMVVAKNDHAHSGLASQFATRSLSRIYAALVWGLLSPAQGEIEGNIGRHPVDRKKMALVKGGGKTALTYYKTKEIFPPIASLVDCRLASGRTHQIRVHMASCNHHLIGDPLYGRAPAGLLRGIPGDLKETLTRFPRQALHAREIRFLHPRTNEDMSFSSPIPQDIRKLVEVLKAIATAPLN